MKIAVDVRYDPPHFNPVAFCNIPGAYRFEVEDAGGVVGATGDHEHYFIYADGFTFREGLEDIKLRLRELLGGGSIRLRGDIPHRSEWDTDVRQGI